MYIYADVDELQNKDSVGTGQCVALVKHYAHMPNTALWAEGSKVIGSLHITKGTVVATFVDGRYPSAATGNHAGFYISGDDKGFWIMDQWFGKSKISSRYIRRKGTSAAGKFVDPSNNADAYSIVN